MLAIRAVFFVLLGTVLVLCRYQVIAAQTPDVLPADRMSQLERQLAEQQAELQKLRAIVDNQGQQIERLPADFFTDELADTPVVVDRHVESTQFSSTSLAPAEGPLLAPANAPFAAQPMSKQLVRAPFQKALSETKPSMVIGGQAQVDSVYFSQDDVSRASVGDLQDATDFRRARIVVRGKAFEVYEYAFGMDFALSGRPSFLDVFIEHRELPHLQKVRVGHFFEPFSLERVTQNRANTFMERSNVDTFAPARNMGVMTFGHTENEMATWQIGTFRTNSDNNGNDSFDSGQALTMRTTRLLWYDEPTEGRYYFHVGAGYSYRDAYRDGVRFRNTPEIRVEQPGSDGNFAPMFIDTGMIPAHNFQLFDGELAWTQGSFSAQSEYAFASVDQIGGPQLFFDAFMIQASYFLTGEHRHYYRPMGIHERVIPNTNFARTRDKDGCINMGPGAWEVAARYSWIRLNDQNIDGNNLYDVTLGINWYWNAYARMKFNYIRAFLQDEATGRSATNIFGVRMDFEF